MLVTGGAAYIGSHAIRQLAQANHKVVVVDNLFRGHRGALRPEVPFYELALSDREGLTRVLTEHEIECLMHFAALAYVGESVDLPLDYYET